MKIVNGVLLWMDEDGRPHREDGPAIVRPDGAQHWMRHGVLHREDGPALVRADGSCAWYVYGVPVKHE